MNTIAHIPDFDFAEPLKHLPRTKQAELERALGILFEEFEETAATKKAETSKRPRILHVILFGSFARDAWVDDAVSGYKSDYDLLVVVNDDRVSEQASCWVRAEDRLIEDKNINREVNVIVHTLQDLNQKLAEGQYFFCDIIAEGIPLYEMRSGGKLGKPAKLDAEAANKQAKEYFEFWFPKVSDFIGQHEHAFEKEKLSLSAFELHQAVESAYACFLLTKTLYVPPSHNIKFLRSLAEDIEPSLRDIWPRTGKKGRKDDPAFALLKRAYVEARYSMKYHITREQLSWLLDRTKVLEQRVKDVCEKKLVG